MVRTRGPWQTAEEGAQGANRWLSAVIAGTHADRWPDDDNWEQWALDRVRVCRTIAGFRADPDAAADALLEYAGRYGIKLKRKTSDAVRARALDPALWERLGWRAYVRGAEALARKLGMVGKAAEIYVSESTVRQIRARRDRSERIVDGLVAVNEEGTAVSLADARNASVSNPEMRRAELMTRLKGCDDFALAAGLVGTFFTLTAPSRMHRVSQKWDGSDPSTVQKYFCGLWARLRAALDRRRLKYFGTRIAEPHKDGTPHWHLLLWCEPSRRSELEALFNTYALKEDGEEPGAKKRRLTCEHIRSGIDSETGKPYSAVGYISKYVAKNVDGFAVGEHKALNRFGQMEETGVPVAEAAERVLAWSRVWAIRQFQFVGTPKVTAWRELRRVRNESQCPAIEPGRRAADEGDWFAFMQANQRAPIELAKEQTGEVSRYGELKPDAIIGVRVGTEWIRTRHHVWRILPSWTCDNNCTRVLGPFSLPRSPGAGLSDPIVVRMRRERGPPPVPRDNGEGPDGPPVAYGLGLEGRMSAANFVMKPI